MKIRLSSAGLALALAASIGLWACQSKEVTSAKVYIQQGDWNKAIEQLQIAVQTYPNDPEAHYLLGRGYAEKSMYKEMNEQFDQSLAISDKFADQIRVTREKNWVDNFNRGVQSVKAGKIDKAEEAFKTAIVIDPKKPDSYRNLAYTYIREDQPEKAIETYQQLLQQDPQDTEAMISLGNLYYNQGEYQKSIDTLQEVLKLEPGNVDAVANIALAYDYLGQRDKAIEFYREAIAKNPNDKDLRFNYGRLFFLAKEYDKAIEQFKKVLEMDPNDAEATLNIGNAYLSLGEEKVKVLREMDTKEGQMSDAEIKKIRDEANEYYSEAIPYLKKSTELDPNSYSTWYNLGVAYVNIGEREEGEAAFKKADEVQAKQGNQEADKKN